MKRKDVIEMNRILFESEIFAKDTDVKFQPFQICIKESIEEGYHKVETIRREFKMVGNKYFSDDYILSTSVWKESK